MLESTDRSLLVAVQATLAALPATNPEDIAAHRLAEIYARQLDDAKHIGRAADKVLANVRKDLGTDIDLLEQVQALRNKLTERGAVENLGPKLLQVLDALAATPKARLAAKGGGPHSGSREGSKLAAVRASRA